MTQDEIDRNRELHKRRKSTEDKYFKQKFNKDGTKKTVDGGSSKTDNTN